MLFGTSEKDFGAFDIEGLKCRSCREASIQKVTLLSKYFHIWWIPMFPIGQRAISECSNCKKTLGVHEFSKSLTKKYWKKRAFFKRPLRHWGGAIFFGLVFIFNTLTGDGKDRKDYRSNDDSSMVSRLIKDSYDKRQALLSRDRNLMTSGPAQRLDSISFFLKTDIDKMLGDERFSEKIAYRSRVIEDRVMILIDLPKASRQQDASRDYFEEIKKLVLEHEMISDKLKYIWMKDTPIIGFMKTPSFNTDVSGLPDRERFVEFYGVNL